MEKNVELGSKLCQNCGLCCSGALFSHAPIADGEKEKAKELDFKPVNKFEDEYVFNQPCPHLVNCSCSIYPNRLHVCGDFHCKLTTNVINGEVAFDDANKDVNSAKEQIKWLTDNALYRETDESAEFNLRNYLHFFRKKMVKQLEEKPISQIDAIYAIKTLKYLKLIDSSFRDTSLSIKFSQLLNSFYNR